MPKEHELSCGVEFMRGILLFLNILFVIFGLILIGLGIYVKVDNNFASILNQLTEEGKFEAQSLGFLAFVMIGGGVFTVLIALFGCIGTLWHSRCSLYTYAIILGLLMIIELVGFIMAFVYKGKLTDVYQTALSDVLTKGLKTNDTKIISAFHDLEQAMKCCGVYNISDYEPYNYTTYSDWCTKNPNSEGCSKAIIDFLNKNLPIIGGTLGGILCLELFCLLAAIALARALKLAPDENYSSNPGEVIRNIVPGRRHNYR